jgi:mono/diheme cytochrome c family protein
MMRASIRILGLAAVVLAFAAAVSGPRATPAQTQHDHRAMPQAAPAKGPRPITMEELHRLGGTPRGWKFALPDGDPARGKQVFAEAGCFQCHAIRGAGFPEAGADKKPGPELTGMGGQHPVEYLAESILAPNAVILDGPGYVGPDGLSIMPSYADSLSVRQLLDLVTYLKSQTESAGGHEHHAAGHEHETTAGEYAIRLVYAPRHVLVFVADKATGDAVPYLPVTLTLKTEGQRPRTVRLEPMVGAQGFHYGADLTIPDEVDQVLVSIRPTTMKVMDSARGRFTKQATASFDW